MTTKPPAEARTSAGDRAEHEQARARALGGVVDRARSRAAAAVKAATGYAPEEVPPTPEHDRMVEYYRECWHARLWNGHNVTSRAMHVGLYHGPADDPEQARLRLDEHVADAAGLGAAPARLLDAGCGIGGTALHLCRRHPALRVTGVNLCPEQVWLGRQLVDAAGLRDRVLLLPRDYRDTGLPAESFDVVLAIDSLTHCDDRPAFAQEAHRVLRPGGCLVLADTFHSARPFTSLEARCYEGLLEGFALADCFARPPEEVFGAAGFVEPWFEDLTARALPGLERESERASTLLQHVQLPPLRRGHERGCVALHALCQNGALRYGVFRARRPGR
jgi:SAM-dependent methyltransferase